MILLRLSGHSGAGKSRLTAALRSRGISSPRAVLYTSRAPREGEVHGRDYYFLSRGAIAGLPAGHFLVGPVREMLQAIDLAQLEADLRTNDLVLIEVFDRLWPALKEAMLLRLGDERESLQTASVFMTAVDPRRLEGMSESDCDQCIRERVRSILDNRGKDPGKTVARCDSAVREVRAAIGREGIVPYDRVFHSAPEGPDGEDEWTRESEPVGRAKQTLSDFIAYLESLRDTAGK